ncbi:hypothetical protein BISA_1233 [Bifidobacterium saguini DSM 23967]|uniref:PMT family glycosyltransferase n=2 Tax=Bifidobacterium saguini TaxID=762210 RepID=A0A087DC19_9BIFI|nr:hypothetical protein BISA_1233 [Bifidobacterium saguini DSM 23967]
MGVHSKELFSVAQPATVHMAKRLRHALLMVLAALAVIASLECIVFNTPFWRTLGASTDTNAVHNALGSGLKRTDDGMLTVTDPTNAYLELTADGTSDFLRIDTVSSSVIDKARKQAMKQSHEQGDIKVAKPLNTVHVRVDVTSTVASTADTANTADSAAGNNAGTSSDSSQTTAQSATQDAAQTTTQTTTGKAQSIGIGSARSHYINASGAGVVRVWIQEERGAIVPVSDARANVKVPFSFNWARVAVMAVLVLLIALWRPGSKLWRITLNPSSARQRWAFAAIMAIPTVILGSSIVWQLLYATPLAFHTAGGYTYDFDQYAHVADSLIAGRPWLDLEVPSQLAQTENPYDVATRLKLLDDGVSPLYWDYVYYGGHWYSYFGVLPAVLLFAPYRLITGRILPTSAAEQFLVLLFIIFFSMLLLRLIHRVMPKTSIAAASLTVASGLLGAQIGYLAYRTNFYQVPFAASLALTSLGLWFWLGADTSARPLLAADRWHAGNAAPLSLPRLALGALCIAANFGCRPTFTLTALLAFPLFWPQIRAMISDLVWRSVSPVKALRAPAAMVLPAIAVVIPLMAWNKVRFGSLLNFGNAYQFTVSDMTRYATPAVDMPYTIWYYLFLPLRFTDQFPWLALSPAPMPTWGYYEVMVGALFTATPLMLLALVLPFLKNLETHGMRTWLLSCLILAGALVIFDGSVGGLGWRYLADFGWLTALAAVPGTLWLVNGREPSRSLAGANDAASGDGIAHVTPWRWLMRWTVLLLVLWTVGIALLGCFVPGRDDAMINNNPVLWHDVQSWFSLL